MLFIANFNDLQIVFLSHCFLTQGYSFRPPLARKELAFSDVLSACVFA